MKKSTRPYWILILALSFTNYSWSAESIPSTHTEIDPIGLTPETKFQNLTNFCLDHQGNLLACDAKTNEIKKITPAGKVLARWKLSFDPWVIHAGPKEQVYVAGQGVVARLNKEGKVVKITQSDGNAFPNGRASGITANEKDVIVCFGFGWSLRSKSSVIRFDHNLDHPKVIAGDMRGCCQRLDIVVKDNVLYIAENARYRVVRMDRDGKVLGTWGQRDRKNIESFGSCCNPMNLCFGINGDLYTAESGLGRIKRYSPEGKFLGLVGYVGTSRFNRAGRQAAACSNITLAVSKDASRIYVLDFQKNLIRILEKNTEAVQTLNPPPKSNS